MSTPERLNLTPAEAAKVVRFAADHLDRIGSALNTDALREAADLLATLPKRAVPASGRQEER